QQHLQTDVGYRLAERRQALPGILRQEPQRHIVGGTTPAFQRQQLRHGVRDGGGRLQQVPCAHSRRQQRLVRVTEGGVGQSERRGLPQPPRETVGAELAQPLLRSGGRRSEEHTSEL